MTNSVEAKFRLRDGHNPKKFEPPLTGPELEKRVHELDRTWKALEAIYRKSMIKSEPKDIHPPSRVKDLAKAVQLLQNIILPGEDIVLSRNIDGYDILKYGEEGKNIYTVIGRRFEDGRVEAAFHFGAHLPQERIAEYVKVIGQEFWIPYTEGTREYF